MNPCLIFLSTAAAAATLTLSATSLRPLNTDFDKGDYFAVSLPANEYQALLPRAEATEGHALKSRGDAHLTVVTPPEMKRLSAEQKNMILSGLRAVDWTQALQSICLGRGQLGKESTYFVVMKAPEIARIRASAGLHEPFYPHVTVGFTKRDLFPEEGVKKDASSCL